MMNKVSYYRDLTIVLTKKEIKVRYKGNVFGYLWSVLNPLMFALVLCLAFQLVFKVGIPNYPLFLICGLFPWQWFSNSVSASTGVFLSNSMLIKKTVFPKSAIALAVVLQDMVHFVLTIPVIMAFGFYYHVHPNPAWLYGIPLLLLIQLVMTYGLTLLLASINLFFRDMSRLMITFMTLLFYCTPIAYSASMIPPRYQWILYANPFAPLMINWRAVLIDGTFVPNYLLWAMFYSLLILFIGQKVFEKLRWKFAEVL